MGPSPTLAWASSILACGGCAAVLALLATRGPRPAERPCSQPQPRTVWALEATFIKAMTDTLTEYGIAGTFVRWPVYAVAVGGVAGTLLVQLALHVGPLRVSQPLLVIVDPVISIVLSIHLFGERFTADAATWRSQRPPSWRCVAAWSYSR